MLILAKSGKAVIFFTSDLAFNLPGFNIFYEFGSCYKNCSNNGHCLMDGSCECLEGFTGDHCQHHICIPAFENTHGPCLNGAMCKNGKCICRNSYHGDRCQELTLNPIWDSIIMRESIVFHPRASHKLAYAVGSKIVWMFGGYGFDSKVSLNELLYLDLTDGVFRNAPSKSIKKPRTRYDHSIIYRKGKIFVFGGVINDNSITNEFWSFDTTTMEWELISPHNESQYSLPMALAGHTAHLIDDEMHVIFGYNHYEGYVFTSQIYSFATEKWTKGYPDPMVMGRFGHASVAFEDIDGATKIIVHGGYNTPLSGYSYSISDELLLYDPALQIFTKLANSNLPLFRHSATVTEDGIMLIFGGNSHNESSVIRKTDCLSSQILAFDTLCKKWIKISAKEFEPISRYGHESFTDGKSVYIVGGFNGQMLNDLLRFTPANCDRQIGNAADCENLSNGIKCIYHDKTCSKRKITSSIRQSFISLIKGENQRTYQYGCDIGSHSSGVTFSSCTSIKDCNSCIIQNCGWCESIQSCLNSDAACADGGFFTDKSKCSFIGKRAPPLRPCNLVSNCNACRQLKHCSWFTIEAKHSCVSLEDEVALIEEYNRNKEKYSLTGSASQGGHFSTIIYPSSEQNAQNMVSIKQSANSTCPQPCSVHSSCFTCISAQCMWCPSKRRCVGMDTYIQSFPYGQCQSWVTAANTHQACKLDPYNCGLQKTCTDCQTVGPRCGWCDDGSGTGLGQCMEGTNSASLGGASCSAAKWFFTGEPFCQCNGHSTCTENVSQDRKCRNCQNRTRGDHCDMCEIGYFGDPRNGGICQECQCNGQAKFCNPDTGDCYCSTKGVTGPNCDKCEPKYLGDPRINRPCTYELVTDFIFTFKLDGEDAKDKYVNQINFFSTPFKRDTDVQFSIICEGESGAKVSINLTSHLIESRHIHTKQLMAGQLCSSTGLKRTYSSTDPGFTFGTEANTTFYVKVNDFITPIRIQISFAQSPPINWILFFVIFAACFIILLVVAGLLWMIKLRVEWYRNLRRRNEEIEEMASRPLGCIHLDMSRIQHTQIMPVSVEPCKNNQHGVYTLIVRLPTGGLPYTPYGASGLAIGSSLCHLTQAQLALLQPPNPEKNQNRKSTFRRLMPFIR